MHNLLERLLPWGIQVILVIQAHTGGIWDTIVRGISFLGTEYFFIFLAPLLLWCVDKRHGVRLAVFFLISAYLNLIFKALFAIPRPFLVSSLVQAKEAARGYAFPSGHAQNAATAWLFLAYTFRKRWLTVLGVILIVLIAFSRIYLGVHYPQDTIAGVLFGAVLMILYARLLNPLETWIARLGRGWQIGGVILIALLMALSLLSDDDALSAAGTLLGFGVGYILEERSIAFQPRAGNWAGVARMVVGLILIGLAYGGLKVVLPSQGAREFVALMRILRYACVGLSISLIGPWLFVKLRLASTRPVSAHPLNQV
jgi:membrane-associated phospholipid phosphatase